jgi:hypothetical protein
MHHCSGRGDTLALRGEPKDPASSMVVEDRSVDLFTHEQYQEWFLCDVNDKGQVC